MSLKLQPWLLRIEYLPGEANTFADALSRQEWESDPKTLLNGSSSGVGGKGMSGQRSLLPACMREKEQTLGQQELHSSRMDGKDVIVTGISEGIQSGVGGCGGEAATLKKKEDSGTKKG